MLQLSGKMQSAESSLLYYESVDRCRARGCGKRSGILWGEYGADSRDHYGTSSDAGAGWRSTIKMVCVIFPWNQRIPVVK